MVGYVVVGFIGVCIGWFTDAPAWFVALRVKLGL